MVIFKNELFADGDTVIRVVKSDTTSAWCIEVDNSLAWPVMIPLNRLVGLRKVVITEKAEIKNENPKHLKKRDEAYTRLSQLIPLIDDLLDPHVRNYRLNEHANAIGCSTRTLHKDLRRFWQGGQVKQALMPTYCNSGRVGATKGHQSAQYTAGRGRKSSVRPVYQMTGEDEKHLRQVIEDEYLQKRKEMSLTDAHLMLLWTHYSYESNGKKNLNPPGEYPSYRQFHHFLHKNFNIEVIGRARHGDAEFDLNHRAVTGTVLADCLGIGHYYEIDATIVDVYLVSKEDISIIIGKPTLYTIRDRYSRLFVGFYFGLENASWNGALQAILSIAEDKEALCKRYGVEYRSADWPAHAVFPAEFLADRGDMISLASTSIADNLHCVVTNVPGKRADWKAVVECGFKELQQTLRTVAPAYDPPSNAMRRRGKHFEKDASLTMNDFGNLLLNSILKLNRDEIKEFKRNPSGVLSQVAKDPISLWNHDLVQRAGAMTRYTEDHVRLSLLRRDVATVTEHGVIFNDLHYSFPEAFQLKWFETARKKRFDVDVAFDTRLCDSIYVFSRDGTSVFRAQLMERDFGFRGYSYEEAKFVHKVDRRYKLAGQHGHYSTSVDFIDATNTTVQDARKKLKTAKPKTRTARRADIKPAREAERAQERAEKAALPALPPSAQVISLVQPVQAQVHTTPTSLPAPEAVQSQTPPKPKPGGAAAGFASALAALRKKKLSDQEI